jgi:putative transposase
VILDLVTEAMSQGLAQKRACQVLSLSPRTLQRWRQPAREGVATPHPRPHNALLPAESRAVEAIIRSPQHADMSCRELSLALLDGPAGIYVSHVTIWQYQVALDCHGPRGQRARRSGAIAAPDTSFVTGPNQLWGWDITYLRTAVPYVFLYLYALMDHFSRKVIAWLVSRWLCSEEVQRLWDQGLIEAGLLDLPAQQWPKSLSDRGAQMRSLSTGQYFKKLGIERLFARPRTPNDNAETESLFATVKTHPVYPEYFFGESEAVRYFSDFFPWYNNVHPHTRLGMLTPEQVHSGQGASILAQRAESKAQALARRRAYYDALRTGDADLRKEALIEIDLSSVDTWPCYSWQGPESPPAKLATPFG